MVSITLFVSTTITASNVVIAVLPDCAAEKVAKARFVFTMVTVRKITVCFSSALKEEKVPSVILTTIVKVVDATSWKCLSNAERRKVTTQSVPKIAIVLPEIVYSTDVSMDVTVVCVTLMTIATVVDATS